MTKTFTMLSAVALIAVAALAQEGAERSASTQAIRLPAERQVYGYYLLIHSALARDTLEGVAEAAATIAKLARSEPKLPASIAEQAEKIAQAKDLTAARAAFGPLSETLIAYRKTGAALVEQFYVLYCPMANNNHGASWLQGTKTVRNPYYGASMLTCGQVTQAAAPAVPPPAPPAVPVVRPPAIRTPAEDARRIDESPRANPALLSQLQPLYDTYVRAGKALAGDDKAKAGSALAELGRALSGVDMKLFTGENHDQWMKAQSELKRLLDQAAQGKDLPALRELYLPISQQVFLIARRFGHAKTLYLMNCSMAFNDKGGQWLSDEKEILNPYFGSAMFKCGEVTQVLAPAAAQPAGPAAPPAGTPPATQSDHSRH
jgi:Cu(I)/Ag(I) efflux system membrane fusion protein